MVWLLDANLLLALCDPRHLRHELAHRWFSSKGKDSWATCPITENGFIRIASHPSYPNSTEGVAEVTAILRKSIGNGGHPFWADNVSLTDRTLFPLGHPLSSGKTTDICLLGLAVKNAGRLHRSKVPMAVNLERAERVDGITGSAEGIYVERGFHQMGESLFRRIVLISRSCILSILSNCSV